jgi:hypothetical protein
MTFEQFLNRADKFYYENEFELRYGQSIMNMLYQVRPDKYKEITQTDLDCFYDDGVVKSSLDYLERTWDDKNI